MSQKSTALATTPCPPSTELAHFQAHPIVTPDKIQAMKDVLGMAKCTDAEAAVAMEYCNRRRLNPWKRQVIIVKRWDKNEQREVMTPQTSIDGFRSQAEATGVYRGQGDAEWCGADGKWVTVWLDKKPPAAARATVYREGWEPLRQVARYEAYVATVRDGSPTAIWKKMPDLMIHKCAEALALRKAFPEALGGQYTDDEMGQAQVEKQASTPHHRLADDNTDHAAIYNEAQVADAKLLLNKAASPAQLIEAADAVKKLGLAQSSAEHADMTDLYRQAQARICELELRNCDSPAGLVRASRLYDKLPQGIQDDLVAQYNAAKARSEQDAGDERWESMEQDTPSCPPNLEDDVPY